MKLTPLPFGLALHRLPHAEKEEKGRYISTVEHLPIEPELQCILAPAMKMFDRTPLSPNSMPGMWDDFVARGAQERAIEAAAMRKAVPFSAGDIRRTAIPGDPGRQKVTSVASEAAWRTKDSRGWCPGGSAAHAATVSHRAGLLDPVRRVGNVRLPSTRCAPTVTF